MRRDDPRLRGSGFPIRTSPSPRLHTAQRRFSQCTTSFLGSGRVGIPRMLLLACASRYGEAEPLACHARMDVVVKLRREWPPASGHPLPDGRRLDALPSDKNSPVAQAVDTPRADRCPPMGLCQPSLAAPNSLSFCFSRSRILPHPSPPVKPCGDAGSRTPALRRAKTPLSHLSYIPRLWV